MISEHAPLFCQPSSIHRTVGCHGWAGLAEGVEEEVTEEIREGLAVHWCGEQIIKAYKPNAGLGDVPMNVEMVGAKAPDGVVITEEMYDAATTYADDVIKTVNACQMGDRLRIEQPVAMPEIHEECWGTPDAWMYDDKARHMYLWDLKYGHSSVDAYENWQLLAYAVGALREVTQNRPLQDFGITVTVNIVQPRCYDGQGPFRRWTFPAIDLRGYVNQMELACAASRKPGVLVTTGPHCKNCPAMFQCPAGREAAANALEYSTQSIAHNPSNVALAYEMSMLARAEDALKFRREAIQADAMARIKAGESIPGYAMEQGYGRSKWLHSDDEVLAMGTVMGVDLHAPSKPLSPAQARDKFKKHSIDPAVISSYYGNQPTSMKLVVDDGTKAKRIFSGEKL